MRRSKEHGFGGQAVPCPRLHLAALPGNIGQGNWDAPASPAESMVIEGHYNVRPLDGGNSARNQRGAGPTCEQDAICGPMFLPEHRPASGYNWISNGYAVKGAPVVALKSDARNWRGRRASGI